MPNTIPGSSGKTIFLTGSSGVLGQALLEKLSEYTVICLVHRKPVIGTNVVSLQGDIASPWLGLSPAEFDDLAKRIDFVVHSAAITSFSQPSSVIFRTNVDGTRYMLDLAAKAAAPFCHISTAFIHPGTHATSSHEPNAYELSKRAAEQVVRESGLRTTIVRPSLITGDSKTGAIAQFQGLHLFTGLLLKGFLPVVPVSPHSYVDFVPQDVVAEAIVALLKQEHSGGEYWLTAGHRALTLCDLFDIGVEHGQRLIGRPFVPPRLVTPDVFDRLIRPVFMPAFPVKMQRIINRAIQVGKYLSIDEPFPTSLPDLEHQLGLPVLPDSSVTFLRGLEYWRDREGVADLERSSRDGKNALYSSGVAV